MGDSYEKRREVAVSTGQWPGEVEVDACICCPFASAEIDACIMNGMRVFTPEEYDEDDAPPEWCALRFGRVAVALAKEPGRGEGTTCQ